MKNRRLLTGVLVSSLVVSLCMVVPPPPAHARSASGHRLVSVTGVKESKDHVTWFEVLLRVPDDADANAVAERALTKLGAQPAAVTAGAAETFPTPGRWPQFFDQSTGNDKVVQFYNPAGQPATGGDYQAALIAGHATWADVRTSTFAFQFGGTTTRCPSLLFPCGDTPDGFNDVGWFALSPDFAGVTIRRFAPDTGSLVEADVVMNSEIDWFADPAEATATNVDAQLIMLHENGHVAGLNHSVDPEAVMRPVFSPGLGPRTLAQDDIDAISRLYPTIPSKGAAKGGPGSLDLSFDTDGKVTTDFPESPDTARAVMLQPDGKIVAAGESAGFALARYHPDGSLDSSFGVGGVVRTPFAGGAQAVVLQPDGKIVAAGATSFFGGDFALVRYNPNGSPDESFGTGGTVTTDFGGFDNASGLVLQSDGKIVAAGQTFTGGGADFALARYQPNGSPDESFGTGGTVTTDFAFDDAAADVTVQPDGKIVAAGRAGGFVGADFALARYQPNGSPDPDFGAGGKVTTDFGGFDNASGLVLQSDGKIVAAGGTFTGGSGDFALARYQPNGSPDPDFGAGGKVTTDFAGTNDSASGVALQPDGKIVAAGVTHAGFALALARYHPDGSLDTSFGTGGKVVDKGTAFAVALRADGKIVTGGSQRSGRTFEGTTDDFLVARYQPTGALDPSFGSGGHVTTDLAGDVFEIAQAVAIQPDGRIVTAGVTSGGSDFALARYHPDGSLDTSFGGGLGLGQSDGRVTTDFAGGTDQAVAVAIQPDGKIVAAGRAVGAGGNNFALARYHPTGLLDTSFDGDGKLTTDFAGGNDQALSVALQPDGKIVAAGRAVGAGGNNFALARYQPDGSLDTSFDTDGKVTTDFAGGNDQARGVAVQPDGRIVAAGHAVTGGSTNFALARYNPNGSLDPSFDTDGKVTTDFGGNADQAFAMALQPDGRIVAAGQALSDGGLDFALARYQPDGSFDPEFSGDGKATTDFGGAVDQAFAVALLPGGRIVAAGQTSTGSPFDFALATYKSNGTLDTKFGGGGKVTTDFGSDDGAFGLAVQPDGRIVAAGASGSFTDLSGVDFALARYHP